MYRSLYLLSVPEDKTVIRSGFSSLLDRGNDESPSQPLPARPPSELGPDYQEPNDDMESLTPPDGDWFRLYEYRDEPQEERKRDVIDWDGHIQSYYAEQDRRDYERDAREYERGYDPIEEFYEYASRSSFHE